MSTVFKRSELYRKTNKKQPLTADQLSELGRIVIAAYIPTKPSNAPIHFKISDEEGNPRVIDYPKKFTAEIDRLVSEYYASIQPKLRKRIPAPRKPINY